MGSERGEFVCGTYVEGEALEAWRALRAWERASVEKAFYEAGEVLDAGATRKMSVVVSDDYLDASVAAVGAITGVLTQALRTGSPLHPWRQALDAATSALQCVIHDFDAARKEKVTP